MSRSFVAASTQYLYSTGASPVSSYPVTISAWFKPTTSHNGTLLDLTHASDNNRIALVTDVAGTLSLFSATAGTSAGATSSGTYTTGVWNHAIGVVSGAASRAVLLNGAGGGSNATSIATTGCGRTYVGSLFANGAHTAGYYFNGLISNVAVWNVALSSEEQAALAAGADPRLVRPTALVSYLPLLGRSTLEEDWVNSTLIGLANNSTTASQDNPRIAFPPGPYLAGSVTPAISDGINIDTPAAGRIHQRSGTTGTITVTGTYTGATGPTTVEARLVQDGTSTPLSTFDWSTKVASPAGGTFSFSFTGVPQGGWYNVQVRWSNNTSINATSGKVGVGALVGVVGQSSAYLWFRSRTTATTPNSLVRVYGNIGGWAAPDNSAMAGAIGFGNALATTLGIPVGVLDYAYDASGLYAGGPAQWIPVSGTANRTFTNGVGALDDKLEAVVWVQGEADAGSSVSQTNYYNSLGTLFADWRTTSFSQASLPIVVATLARRTVAGYTDAAHMAIYDAQVQKCADANIYRVDRKDLGMDADGVHHNPAGYEALGARCARAVAYAIGSVATYRGPRISSVTQVSAAVFDVHLTHDMGSDFTPASPTSITGARFLDGGTPATISSALRTDASTFRVTLSSTPGALPVVQYLYGNTPTVTDVVIDNGALSLPLEGTNTAGVTATSNPATATTLTGPSSGLTGVASTNFTVGVMPIGGIITGTLTVTPDDNGGGGSFTPASLSLTTVSPTGTFTYTPASTGAKSIGITNDGLLTVPSDVTYTATAATTGTTLTGPSSGTVGSLSTNFTAGVTPVGSTFTSPITITPSDGGDGGTFTPATLQLTTGSPTNTFKYTAASAGAKTISIADDRSLTDATPLTYTAEEPATPGVTTWYLIQRPAVVMVIL